ncbi:DUF4328 domain-containing protein [Mycobacterium sp. MYCO198283]|uniref:DUF4328 domain-containing protein n=1 Tax=Mycobacterium sp. MYCO198283 TaxID=2883505 RepID=UPI001E57B8F1|nr:DUF4328 domain-containing protein [Mycobacterium sp. MYCO198283]MCG5433007.1 DUF4328 domain-containing protein [Mycobacterium sp. MYCO198283]
MIQVCSRCGTRWNVRDRRRVWCPRCQGTLLAPSADPSPAPGAPTPSSPRGATNLPPGYRWIALRPGAPPRRGPRRTSLGPTPRYATIPRWGLVDPPRTADERASAAQVGPSYRMVRLTLLLGTGVLGAAALLYLVRYLLMVWNRSVLLPRAIAWFGVWPPRVVGVLAIFAAVAVAVVLTEWLIARRAAAFAHQRQQDPRRPGAIRLGCLLPVANLFWAPVFLIELAMLEGRYTPMRRPVTTWWLVWVASYLASLWATAVPLWAVFTARQPDTQGIADNTEWFVIAYLLATAAVLLAARLVARFEAAPVQRPAHRWVVVPREAPAPADVADRSPDASRVPVEQMRAEPAA